MNRIPARALVFVLLAAPGLAAAGEHPARLVGAADHHLGVPVSGVVTEVHVAAGERVQAGEELLRLEQAHRNAELAAARARMEAEELAREEAERESERARTLYDRKELSDHDRQIAINEAAAAEAAHREAVAAHERARLDRAYSRLEAPVAGRVIAVEVHPGMAVASRDQIRTLVRLRPAEAPLGAVARLPGHYPGDLVEGSTVAVARGDAEGEAVIREVSAVDGGWRVRLALTAAPEGWRPGQSVTVSLPE